MSAIRDQYLLAGEAAVTLLRHPAVAQRWNQPSALAEFSVRGLAGHLAQQVFRAEELVTATEPTGDEWFTVDEHYGAARWISAIDTPDNVGVRERGESLAADGPDALAEQAGETLRRLRTLLPAAAAHRSVLVPWTGRRMTLDDFLLTRLLELTIHCDDLAVSVDVPPPALPDEVYAPVIEVLSRMSVRVNGSIAVLRALARRDRAPETIAAI